MQVDCVFPVNLPNPRLYYFMAKQLLSFITALIHGINES